MFQGFPEETIRFFLDIRFHNEISYYKAHEDEYRQFVKEPFYSFIEALAPYVQEISDDMEVRPVKCLARLRRDTRFTKDKSPFRDHLWLLFRRSGEARDTSVMYWFEMGTEHVDWGLGFWGDNRPAMDALRRRMLYRPSEVLDAFKESGIPDPAGGLQVSGDAYRRMKVPEEVPPPLIPMYPLKSIYIRQTGVPFKTVYTPKLVDKVAQDILRLKPVYQLLRAAADEGMSQLDA